MSLVSLPIRFARRRLKATGLGEPANSTSFFDAVDRFRAIRTQLNQLEAETRTNPDFARQYAAQIGEAEQQYQNILRVFTTLYRAAFGTVPAGLAQLTPLGAGATIAAVLTALLVLAYFLQPLMRALQSAQQARLAQAETGQAEAATQQATAAASLAMAQKLQEQSAAAAATGNTQLAAQLAAQATALAQGAQKTAGSPSGPSSSPPWLPYAFLGLAGAGIYIALR
jgi:hypothetical protein